MFSILVNHNDHTDTNTHTHTHNCKHSYIYFYLLRCDVSIFSCCIRLSLMLAIYYNLLFVLLCVTVYLYSQFPIGFSRSGNCRVVFNNSVATTDIWLQQCALGFIHMKWENRNYTCPLLYLKLQTHTQALLLPRTNVKLSVLISSLSYSFVKQVLGCYLLIS